MPSLQEIEQLFWLRVWRCSHRSCRVCCWPWGPQAAYQNIWHCYRRRMRTGGFMIEKDRPAIAAHRMAYILAHGGQSLLPGRTFAVCHLCDYHACCNPRHLCLGAQSDNCRDKLGKAHEDVLRYVIFPDGRHYPFLSIMQLVDRIQRFQYTEGIAYA